MYQLTSKLLLFSNLGQDSILTNLSRLYRQWERCECDPTELVSGLYSNVKQLLDLATTYGFDTNLWHNYLSFVLITNENSFTLTAERIGAREGSVNHFARGDFEIFRQLFAWDFGPLEQDLGIDCFSTLLQYQSLSKQEKHYYRAVSEKVQALSKTLALCQTGDAFFDAMSDFYKSWGVGMFGLNKAFRIHGGGHVPEFLPINNTQKVVLEDLVGYELQKKELVANTEAFVMGKPANNVLLYGDAGTGKSTCVKAVLNQFYDQGLRMIEIYKHQFQDLSGVIAAVKGRNYRFIIYLDDLSFEEHEIEYKYLKAVIEGGVETRPDNVLIYATSNRRHLIRETWSDRRDMEYENEMHRSDTIEEKLSLSNRFGVSINFSIPDRQAYHQIVLELANKQLRKPFDPQQLLLLANRWEIRHGGVSGRTAQQFINYMAGTE